MKALVTGGAGFIGSHVVDNLVDLGYDVVVVDDLSGGFAENINPAVVFHKVSITDKVAMAALFEKEKFDYVFHLAAYAAEGLSHFIRNFNYTNNLIGSINLINESVKHNIKCFVFTSSIAVYGHGQTPMIESTVPHPVDPYGISKYATELDLEAANKLFGLNYIVFRPHNVYGERQNIGDKYRNVIGIFMNNMLQGKDIIVFGDGEQQRAFSHISGIAESIASSITNQNAYNQVFNVGDDKPYTINQLINIVAKEMDWKGDVIYEPARDEVSIAFADHSKFNNVFKDYKTVSLESGIEQMAKWVKSHGSKQTSKFENIEILKNLPQSWK